MSELMFVLSGQRGLGGSRMYDLLRPHIISKYIWHTHRCSHSTNFANSWPIRIKSKARVVSSVNIQSGKTCQVRSCKNTTQTWIVMFFLIASPHPKHWSTSSSSSSSSNHCPTLLAWSNHRRLIRPQVKLLFGQFNLFVPGSSCGQFSRACRRTNGMLKIKDWNVVRVILCCKT